MVGKGGQSSERALLFLEPLWCVPVIDRGSTPVRVRGSVTALVAARAAACVVGWHKDQSGGLCEGCGGV